jgi:phenylalanyl-tRNA synthetase beta chain
MISKSMIASCSLSLKNHLRLINSISEELTYLRNSLVPSLVKNIKENQGRKDELKLFEIAKVYLPKKNDLPEEPYNWQSPSTPIILILKELSRQS